MQKEIKDFEGLLDFFLEEDCTNSFLKNHHFQLGSKVFNTRLEKALSFTNKILSNLNSDLVIVCPGKKEMAYLTSIFSSLFFFKKNFNDRYNNFENWLKINSNVKLCSSGDQTGKVYKYLGPSQEIPKNIKLGSLSGKFNFIDFPINTILQLCPTKLDKPEGNGKIIPNPKLTTIDTFLEIKSYGNPILYEDRIILLTNTYLSYLNFLNEEKIINTKNFNSENSYGELIRCEEIKEDGTYELNKDPLILYTKALAHIYEYSLNIDKNKIVISDQINKFNKDFIILNQIKNRNKNIKFLIFSEEHEQEEILNLQKKISINIWKLNSDEIGQLFRSESENFDNISNVGKIILKNKIYLNKKNIFLETGDNIFNKIDFQFKKIIKIQNTKSEEIKEITKDILAEMYIKMYVLRDHIFGFTEELQNDFESSLERFSEGLGSRKSFLDQDILDYFAELKSLFNEIPKFGNGLFDQRIKELGEILKLRHSYQDENYALLVHRAKIKQYYKKHIKEKWNLEPEIIYSLNNSNFFKHLIIPSELPPSKISNLLLNNNFENIYFLGGRNLKEEINKKKVLLDNNWKSTDIDGKKKCEILGVNQNLSNIFTYQNNLVVNKYKDQSFTGSALESFFHYNVDDLLNRDVTSSSEKNVKALPIIFNGNCYAYLTENFKTELYNNVFDKPNNIKNANFFRSKKCKDLQTDDIIFLRDGVDKDTLESESIIILKNNKSEYLSIKSKTLEISYTLNSCFGKNFKKKDIIPFLNQVDYTRDPVNVISISNPNEGTLCPNKFSDLEKIFLACEKKDPHNFKYNKAKTRDIFNHAKKLKQLHIQAGRKITEKLKHSLRNLTGYDYDGDPLRIDYDKNVIQINSEESNNPEGWIVQVNSVSDNRELKEVRMSLTNRVIFL